MCSTWPKLLSLNNNVIQLLQKLFSFNDNNYSTSAMYGELILTYGFFFVKNVLKILGHSKCRHIKSLRTVSSQIRFITHPVHRPQQMASEDGTTGREGAWSSRYGSRVLQVWMIHCSCRLLFFPFSKSEKKTKMDPKWQSREKMERCPGRWNLSFLGSRWTRDEVASSQKTTRYYFSTV